MCRPKSEGGKRCANHSRKKTEKLMAERDELKEKRDQVEAKAAEENSDQYGEEIRALNYEIQFKESQIETSRLEYAGTQTGQEEIAAAIANAEKRNDYREARKLRDYSAKARQHTEDYMTQNIREYQEEVAQQDIRENYLPEVYRKAEEGAFPDYIPSGQWTPERIEQERQALEQETDETRRAHIAENIEKGEKAQAFWTNWLAENSAGKTISWEERDKAKLAVKVAEKDHGINSPQYAAAFDNNFLLQQAHTYQYSYQAQEYNKRIHQMEAQREIERQQKAIHKGEILRDARFDNDMERRMSPHGVDRRDVSQASISVENAKKTHGKDSPQYTAAVKDYDLVRKAYATRKEILKQQRRRERFGGLLAARASR